MAAKRPKNERSVFKSNQQRKEKQKAANSACVCLCVCPACCLGQVGVPLVSECVGVSNIQPENWESGAKVSRGNINNNQTAQTSKCQGKSCTFKFRIQQSNKLMHKIVILIKTEWK